MTLVTVWAVLSSLDLMISTVPTSAGSCRRSCCRDLVGDLGDQRAQVEVTLPSAVQPLALVLGMLISVLCAVSFALPGLDARILRARWAPRRQPGAGRPRRAGKGLQITGRTLLSGIDIDVV
jgi:hypothetical protein